MNRVQEINFTPKAKRVLDVAKQACIEKKIAEISDDFLFYAVLKSDSMIVNSAFAEIKISPQELAELVWKALPSIVKGAAKENVEFTAVASKIINESLTYSKQYNQNYTGVEHIFRSALTHSPFIKKFFKKNGIDIAFIVEKIDSGCKNISNPKKKAPTNAPASDSSLKSAAIKNYCINYNEKAMRGDFDLICFREKEVAQMSEILCRKQKKNPIIVGEAGVGKSAVVGLLAKNIVSGDCTEFLLGKIVLQLDMTALVAGTNLRGQFEERLHKILNEVKAQKNIILFIDEIHTITGTGNDEGSLDASNILKPYLAGDEISCIGATTQKEYEKYFQNDSAMNRRFEPLFIKEPSKEDTLKILKNIKQHYEAFHAVSYPDSILEGVVDLCAKYITNRRFPDKAIDLMDHVGSKSKIKVYARPVFFKDLEKKIAETSEDDDITFVLKEYEDKYNQWFSSLKLSNKSVTKQDLYAALSDKIGVFIDSNVSDSKFKNIFANLQKHVFGQDEALKKISNCVVRSSFGLSSPNRPLGSFMFLGPTGSGKTYLAKTLAMEAFGSEASLVRLDMSEYMEQSSVTKLLGSAPGYIGFGESNVLSEQLQKFPSSVFLFDEIEKAHPDVINILLQIMDNGQLTTSVGRKLDFKNSIIILTGNIGFQFGDSKKMGFFQSPAEVLTKDAIKQSLQKFFRPEFLARLNDVVVFNSLPDEALRKIAEKEVSKIKDSLKEKNVSFIVTEDLYSLVVAETKNSNDGARKVIFFVENELKTKIVDVLASGSYNHIEVSIENGAIKVDGKSKKLRSARNTEQRHSPN
jgi:ATP-dependent Clp protease ATP-binding subunit ClpC